MTTPKSQPSIRVKTLSDSPNLKSIWSSNYVNSDIYPFDFIASEPHDYSNSIPTVDFSLLTSIDPHQRPQAINNLNKACQEWGFFMVVNHGIQESLMKKVIDGTQGFFNIREEEKKEFEGKHVLDPIRYGTCFNTS
uniref:Leucoanthocyanidin dioxygenase n=1 Tax=Solanum tuberosum TaxID=4113 RepID=M1CHI3_SOLTU